jgi:hypothetical protein
MMCRIEQMNSERGAPAMTLSPAAPRPAPPRTGTGTGGVLPGMCTVQTMQQCNRKNPMKYIQKSDLIMI